MWRNERRKKNKKIVTEWWWKTYKLDEEYSRTEKSNKLLKIKEEMLYSVSKVYVGQSIYVSYL